MTVTLTIPRAEIKTIRLGDATKIISGLKPKKPNTASLAAAIQKMKSA